MATTRQFGKLLCVDSHALILREEADGRQKPSTDRDRPSIGRGDKTLPPSMRSLPSTGPPLIRRQEGNESPTFLDYKESIQIFNTTDKHAARF